MMTTDMRKSPPESFADLKERNYTLFIMEDSEQILTDYIQFTQENRKW